MSKRRSGVEQTKKSLLHDKLLTEFRPKRTGCGPVLARKVETRRVRLDAWFTETTYRHHSVYTANRGRKVSGGNVGDECLSLPGIQGEAKANIIGDTLAVRACRVSFTDVRGIRHSADVEAESLYEAAVLGIRRLNQD